MKLEVIRDQSRYIYAALHEINLHLILGSILACIVVLAFMRSWRSTIIAAVAIPASVISTFGMMWALGFTLNSVTMLALVLMVGVVIDDAIVVLENIFRFVEEKAMTPFEAARAATAEIGLAVMATTLQPGRHLRAGVFHVEHLRTVSLPIWHHCRGRRVGELAGLVHADADDERAHVARRGCRRRRTRTRVRVSTLGSIAATSACSPGRWPIAPLLWRLPPRSCLSSIPLYKIVRQEYIPTNVDEAEFDVNVTAPEGISLASMDEIMQTIESEIRALPLVRLMLCDAGGGFLGGVNQGSLLRSHRAS